jgi:signal peptidase II
LPDWIPFFGGERFRFFNAIFNVSDIAITFGVIVLVLAFLVSGKENKERENSNEESAVTNSKND